MKRPCSETSQLDMARQDHPSAARSSSSLHVTDGTELAADLARALADAPTGLPCDTLARRLRRRRTDVLATLQADARFVRLRASDFLCRRFIPVAGRRSGS